ncbi:hypothetical protein GALMADRAFT_138039 [Galerina marginata CBS 339.88]|uniref:BTB domain-containing protein n=1 Tax=Galerina marginata (strain CBS 339.88) TaxID=685588 RepID=A0A067T3W9_GALM3|nr:hypothetical protein GALMADRAFT_138039 [Galerina marginata CBS 339.88]
MAQPARLAQQPWLESVEEKGFRIWTEDLKTLLQDAENQYPDVVWETRAQQDNDGSIDEVVEQIWGHQAILHARAPQTFLAMYLPETVDHKSDSQLSPLTLRRLQTPEDHDHTSFIRNLAYFYTGQFVLDDKDPSVGPNPEPDYHLKLLLKNLVSLLESRHFSDVEIALWYTNNSEGLNDSAAPAIFHSHRFVLSLRSPRFRDIIVKNTTGNPGGTDETLTIHLPSPLFTPDSIQFILEYLYSGTLHESRRLEDSLSTAFDIFRGSVYLVLPTLTELIQVEIVVNLLDGLFYASLSNSAYMKLVSGEWTTMVDLGCRCKTCARRVPLVLQFALEDGIRDEVLERGARRTLVGLFGAGWYTEEFAALPRNITELILTDVRQMIRPQNVLPLLFAAENTLLTYDPSKQDWHRPVRAMVCAVLESVQKYLCAYPQACLQTEAWENILQEDEQDSQLELGSDREIQVRWVMKALLKGADLENWSATYQTVLSLANPQTRRRNTALITPTIRLRAQNEPKRREFLGPSSSLSLSIQEPSSNLIAQARQAMLGETENALEMTAITGRQSPTNSSIFSLPIPMGNLEGPTDERLGSNAMSDGELANTLSLYSSASSRTLSTDYGLLYTRRAFSQETIQDWDADQLTTRRRSHESAYDSFWAGAL